MKLLRALLTLLQSSGFVRAPTGNQSVQNIQGRRPRISKVDSTPLPGSSPQGLSQVSLSMAITFSGPWYGNRGGAGVQLIARDYYYQETLSATVRGPTPTVSLAVVLSLQRVWWEVDLSLFSGALQALGGWV